MAGAVYVLTLADGSAREGTLDADGQAVIAALEPGVVYSLSFLDYDHTTWGQVEERTPPPSLPSWVTIVLVDEAGAPVAEAVYVLTLADGSTHTGVLGATGEVVLTELAGGVAYSLSFPEYDVTVWASIEEIQAPTTLAGWVQVALVDEAGVPGAGAVYVLTLVDGSTQEGWLDAAGQAVITDLEPGIAYHLSFPDYDVTAWRQVEERQVVAPSSGWVRLALVDEEDVPVVEATYVLTLANGSTRTGALDADGQAVVADLEPGIVYYLSFPTYDRTAWERVDAVRTAESRPGWVAMTLVDEAGTPMAGAAYVLTLEDGNSREDALDAAGQVLLEDLEPGQAYRLSFPQVAATAWGRDDGQAPATPPGWIAMTLADEDGMPMAGAAYVLTLADGSTSEGWLDVAGQAVLVGLEPGEVYCLSFPAYDGADWDLVRG
jgi:hypothetical protein